MADTVLRRTHRRRTSIGIVLTYVISLTLLFGSAAVFTYPLVANWFANQARTSAVAHYDKELNRLSAAQLKAMRAKAQQFNQNLWFKQIGQPVRQPVAYNDILQGVSLVGTIDIPAIDIKDMAIFPGTDENTLSKGLGTMTNTSFPIGGTNTRSIITGHTGVENQVLFSDINTLKRGDVFFLNVLGKKLAYQVNSIQTVWPSDIKAVRLEENQDLVTLLTCTPPGINTWRLLVTGKRIPLKQAEKLPVVKRNLFSYQNLVLMGLALLLLLMLIWWAVRRHKKKKAANTRLANLTSIAERGGGYSRGTYSRQHGKGAR